MSHQRLKDRVAIITGAAGPLGAATARRFLHEGALVVLLDVSQRRLDELAAQLDAPARVLVRKCNALRDPEVAAAVAAALGQFGTVDILVNVVGGIIGAGLETPMVTMTEESIDQTLALNLKTIFIIARHVVPVMQRNGFGRIINVASIAAGGTAGQAGYSAAKAGVVGLTKTMAMEFAPAVTVNCIAPTIIRTAVVEKLSPAAVDAYVQKTLLKRLGEPEDVAGAALFLASDDASFITAATLPVTGGSPADL